MNVCEITDNDLNDIIGWYSEQGARGEQFACLARAELSRRATKLDLDCLDRYPRNKPEQPKMLTCCKCGMSHKPPRRGDSIRCRCGLVFW